MIYISHRVILRSTKIKINPVNAFVRYVKTKIHIKLFQIIDLSLKVLLGIQKPDSVYRTNFQQFYLSRKLISLFQRV